MGPPGADDAVEDLGGDLLAQLFVFAFEAAGLGEGGLGGVVAEDVPGGFEDILHDEAEGFVDYGGPAIDGVGVEVQSEGGFALGAVLGHGDDEAALGMAEVGPDSVELFLVLLHFLYFLHGLSPLRTDARPSGRVNFA